MIGDSPTMTPERWERVKKIFEAVMSLPAGERERVVPQLCEGDSSLKSEILRLLSAEEQAGSFLRFSQLQTLSVAESGKASQAQALGIGQIIAGRFQIRRLIGVGGMGEVYEAWDCELQQKVALKTIRQDIAAHPGIIDRFKAEVKESLRITHPNVCRVYQLASHQDGCPRPIWFLTMELLEGRSVAQRLATDGAIPYRQASELIQQMVSGLACAHEAGIVHRDLKPSNLMLVGAVGKERLLVTDFGLAVSTSSSNAFGTAGTPAYMAPEQVSGGRIGPQADVFAVGLIICELLSGKRPALDPASSKTCTKQLNAWLASNSKIPRRLRPIIRRCLRFSLEERFSSAREVARLLEKRRWSKAERAVAAGMVVAAAVALLAIILPGMSDHVVDEVQVTPNNTLSGEPSLSADGKDLAYMSNRADPGNLDIWIQFAGGTPRRLTSNASENTSPSVSPDGKVIAFKSERDGGGIYLIGADGTGERLLVPEGRNPSFSPDGSAVAYWVGAEDTQQSAQIYIISVRTGVTHRLAANFMDARYPTWTSAGILLFRGCQVRSPDGLDCSDWWAVDPRGGEPENTGLLALLRHQQIEPVFPPQVAWQDNHMLVSGRRERNAHVWDVLTNGAFPKAVGRPLQMTFGEQDEMALSVATTNGTIAIEHVTGTLHLWRIGVPRAATESTTAKVTDTIELDCCPTISGDGRLLFFARKSVNFRQLMKVDVRSGNESTVYLSHEEKLWPLPNYDGRVVAFESRLNNQSSIVLWKDNMVRTLCNACSHPSAWISDGDELVYTTNNGDIAVLNTESGKSRTVVTAGPGRVLAYPDYSPKNEHLLFTETSAGQKQLFAASLPKRGEQSVGTWTPLTSKGDIPYMARWSSDGKKFYYFSRKDGHYCLWGNSFDSAGKDVGRAFPVKHYHEWGRGPSRTSPDELGLSVSEDWIYTNPGDLSVTLWAGRLQRHISSAFLRRTFQP